MKARDRTRAFSIALASAIVLLLITQSPRLQGLIEPPPRMVQVEGRYLPVPGNRFHCPERHKDGRVYVGYVAHQADGSGKPVIPHCVYMTPRAGLI